MTSILRPTLVVFTALTLVVGVAYPLTVSGIAKLLFPAPSAGRLIKYGGVVVGSALIGQRFSEPKHFWGRPSATSPMANNAANSSGSNQGPLSPALLDAVKSRINDLKAADPDNTLPIPVDLVTASASGLDPDISVAAANYQAARVARARGVPLAQVQAAIARHTEGQWLGFLGEPRVNVLKLNLALGAAAP